MTLGILVPIKRMYPVSRGDYIHPYLYELHPLFSTGTASSIHSEYSDIGRPPSHFGAPTDVTQNILRWWHGIGYTGYDKHNLHTSSINTYVKKKRSPKRITKNKMNPSRGKKSNEKQMTPGSPDKNVIHIEKNRKIKISRHINLRYNYTSTVCTAVVPVALQVI